MFPTVDLAETDCSGRGDEFRESDVTMLDRTGEEAKELHGDLLLV